MDGAAFLYSGMSHYVVQSIVHSIVIALVVEGLLRSWRVSDPISVSNFRLLVLLLPPITAIGYQIAFPWRNSAYFRESGALFDSIRWIGDLTLGIGPLWYLLFLLILISTFLFVVQELTPTISYHFFSRRLPDSSPREGYPRLATALGKISQETRPPELRVVNHPDPIAYVPGAGRASLVISRTLLDILDDEEIEGVLAHELSHVQRGDNWHSWIIFILRCLMFFNPLAGLAFHQIVQDTEKACDDRAVAITGKPLAFGSALIKTYKATTAPPRGSDNLTKWLAVGVTSLENRARRVIVEERVQRIVRPHTGVEKPFPRLRLATTTGALMVLLYFVV